MAFGKHVAIVPIDRIDGRSTRKRGAGNARPPAIEQHARSLIAPAELRRGIRTCDARGARPRPRRGDADQVEQAARRLQSDVGRKIGKRDSSDERRDIGKRGRRLGRSAIVGHQKNVT